MCFYAVYAGFGCFGFFGCFGSKIDQRRLLGHRLVVTKRQTGRDHFDQLCMVQLWKQCQGKFAFCEDPQIK